MAPVYQVLNSFSRVRYGVSLSGSHWANQATPAEAGSLKRYLYCFLGVFSQVVYFHDAQYERRARIPLGETADGDPMQVLPAIRQLYPEVGLHYEEDHVDLSQPTGRWFWMVLPGRIYLVGPDQRIYHSENVTSLLRVYLELRD